MLNIAIVEDSAKEAEELKWYIERYAEQNDITINITVFDKPLVLLSGHTMRFDLIFLDIELPGMNGMEVAERIREENEVVEIVFVTHMRQFAVNGYAVGARGYLVKPVVWNQFVQTMNRSVRALKDAKSELEVVVPNDGGLLRLRVSDIRYVEILNHNLIYHTGTRAVSVWGNLKEVEKRLEGYGFARCNSCYLVNMRYVTSVRGYIAEVDGIELQISHPRRKQFMLDLAEYLGTSGR